MQNYINSIKDKLEHKDIHIIEFECLTSTNDYLRELKAKKDLEDFTVIVSQYQTAGKGQREKKWESNKNENLLFSIYLRPQKIHVSDQFLLTQLISVSIVRYLRAALNISDAMIKWPNDIYVGDKKLAGVLIENAIQGKYIHDTIIGVGMNVNQESFDPLLPNPISLKMILGAKFKPKLLLEDLMPDFVSSYLSLDIEWLNRNYLKMLKSYGKETNCIIDGRTVKGEIIGIGDLGHLKMIIGGEIMSFMHGEIEFLY